MVPATMSLPDELRPVVSVGMVVNAMHLQIELAKVRKGKMENWPKSAAYGRSET